MTNLDASTIAIISGILIPLVVGVISKTQASAGLKAILNAGLSALAGFLVVLVPDKPFSLKEAVVSIGTVWAIGVATYFGLWKPAGVTEAIQEKTSGFGIG